MRRCFVPADILVADEVALDEETAHYLSSVLRLKAGTEILLLDGRGAVCRSRLESLRRRAGRARVLERRRESDTAFPLHLLQALPKGDKLETVLQKGTELGVTSFSPLTCERSLASPPEERAQRRLQRWQKIVQEAARQCRRPVLPEVSAPQPLGPTLEVCREELRLLLWEEGSRPLQEALPEAAPAAAAVLVGPEGGLAPQEVEQARSAGFVPVSLGPRILRTETAGPAVAAILQHRYGDLGRRSELPGR